MQDTAKPKIIAVMPAYNAATTLERTLKDIPPGTVDEIILVDDCSRDNTVELAKSLGLTVIRHEKNTGYGGNQKTCYTAALERGADIVVMIHPDYQYDSRVIPVAAELIRLGNCDVILGSRIRTRQEALQGGMPAWKYIANRCLTIFENVALGQNMGDFHSGFRAYRREYSMAGKLQRFCLRYAVSCSSRLLQLPSRRYPRSSPLFCGSLQHQFSPQYSLRIADTLGYVPVLVQPAGDIPFPYFQA
jgi:glycosyltransferase involved in cell wall biosynthesis